MRARWYNPAVERFISEDPARNGQNWYAYCNNNPINLVDKTGRSAEPPNWVEVTAMIGASLAVLACITAAEGDLSASIKCAGLATATLAISATGLADSGCMSRIAQNVTILTGMITAVMATASKSEDCAGLAGAAVIACSIDAIYQISVLASIGTDS